ncbi:hypothetical protein ACFVY0_40170 [Streptomyces sp. NPDC058286]|uniref:hypothetical protein n=1 Tax=Streptomyces sp. NPDC058286 TaxID=3346422 RepID=UPI0036E771A9
MVTVSLTGSSKEDAAAVFGVLRTAFPTALHSDDVPHEQLPGSQPFVRTAEFELTQERIPTGAPPLSAPVTATLQGAYLAVDQLREALGDAFAVKEQGSASGDQEKEVELELGTQQ